MWINKVLRLWLLNALISLVVLSGCATTSSSNTSSLQDIKDVNNAFTQFSKYMIEGKLDQAYKCLSTAYQSREPYESFVKNYQDNPSLPLSYRNAFLSNISVDGREASAQINWGTGEKGLFVFIKEGPTWKIGPKGSKSIQHTE